jgi:hypothetical protein
MPDSAFKKFTNNKPLFYGTLGVVGIGAVLYFRHRQSTAASAATGTSGTVTDPDGNVCAALNPDTGFCPGSPGDQAAIQQMAGGGFAGNPFGGGTFGTSGIGDGTGGATGQTVNDLTTKEAWVQAAESILPNGSSATVRDALLGVLGGLTVTQAQRDIFLEAVGVLGDPPGGYPKPIKVSDTSGHPGSGKVTVPSVKGMHYDQAAVVIKHAGLDPQRAEPNVGIVETESPSAGSHVQKGSVVLLGHKK